MKLSGISATELEGLELVAHVSLVVTSSNIDSETAEVKTVDATNIEVFESPVNTADSQNIEIPNEAKNPETEKPTNVEGTAPRSAKILWERLKKIYGNDPTTAGSSCEDKKNNGANSCVGIEGRLDSCKHDDEEETHLFMEQETKSEENTSNCDKAGRSYWQDVLGSDEEDEEEGEAHVNLEGEFLSALDELRTIRNEFKSYKESVHKECSQLRTCLEESNKNVCMLTFRLEESKGMTDRLKSVLDANKRRCEVLQLDVETKDEECQKLKEEMENLRKDLEKCENELKVRNCDVEEEEEDMENRSNHQDLFGSEREEEDEAKVDLEGDFVNSLEELSRVRREYKLFKNTTIVEKNWLTRWLEEFEKRLSELKPQAEETKECWCEDLASRLEVKNVEYL
ncbi:uncharacterized protein LOC131858290 [Cryptomeria japonica]|uniref:uncharacterized protein LOC131858290 n=1 Tax=Cryptomeria japonica TaxID=3369 RepID=UPI0027DA0874|nr:uncharacterized protein LOC131858290 [Cryptomeria japonica]